MFRSSIVAENEWTVLPEGILFISLSFNLQEQLEIKFYTTAEVGVNALLSHHTTSLCWLIIVVLMLFCCNWHNCYLKVFLCNLIDMLSSCLSGFRPPSSQWYVQGAGGPNHYPLCWHLYVLGLDACLYQDKLRWNEAYPHKLVAAWMMILVTYLISYVS